MCVSDTKIDEFSAHFLILDLCIFLICLETSRLRTKVWDLTINCEVWHRGACSANTASIIVGYRIRIANIDESTSVLSMKPTCDASELVSTNRCSHLYHVINHVRRHRADTGKWLEIVARCRPKIAITKHAKRNSLRSWCVFLMFIHLVKFLICE